MSSQADYLSHLEYVKHNSRSGTYKLRKTHVYYHQATGYIGLAGSAWEDFYVATVDSIAKECIMMLPFFQKCLRS